MSSSHWPGADSWNKASGDLARGDLVGGPSRSGWICSWVQKTCRGCTGRCLEPQSNRHGGLRAANQQSAVGGRAREGLAFRASDGSFQRSVANVSQIVALDKSLLTELVGKIPRSKVGLLLAGIDVMLGK